MKFTKETVKAWRKLAVAFLAAQALHPDHVKTGRNAWTVARRCGITRQAYADRTVTDGHIQTALERIFPNAVFHDAKVY